MIAAKTYFEEHQALNLRLIGSSDAPVVVRRDPYRERIDLWARCYNGVNIVESPWLEEAGDMGKRLEHEIARAGLERKMRLALPLFRPESITPAHRTWQRYSLDFVAGLVDYDGEILQVAEPRLIECKIRNRFTIAEWGRDGTSEIGIRELVQVQFQMEAIRADRDAWVGTDVPDIEHVDVIALVDGQHLQHHPVPYDADLAGLIREECEKFWRDHVLTGVPPELEYGEGTARELRRRHPMLSAGDRIAPAHAQTIAAELNKIRAQRKAIEEEEAKLHLKLAEIAGAAKRLHGEDWTWSQSDQDGSLRWGELLRSLQQRCGLTESAFEDLKNNFRGAPKRVPRLTWKGE